MRALPLVALGVALLTTAPYAAALLHDNDCLVNNPGGDAGDTFPLRSQLGRAALMTKGCTGEMLVGVDSDDWYYHIPNYWPVTHFLRQPIAQKVIVDLCITQVKTAPGDADLEVYARQARSPNTAGPGELLGASSNPGAACERVEAQYLVTPLTEIVVHIKRVDGDQLYNLKVAFAM